MPTRDLINIKYSSNTGLKLIRYQENPEFPMSLASVLLIILLAVPGVVITLLVIINFERHIPDYMENDLLRHFAERASPDSIDKRVNFAELQQLPAPVARYLQHVLTDGQPLISLLKIRQTGELRTMATANTWFSFTAKQLVTAITPGFVWGAKVNFFARIWLRVLDAYLAGSGRSKVDLLSVIPLGSEADVEALNAGALYRYLAEAVWYPTALIPGCGVEWSPVDDRCAIATLTDSGINISLEFRFNENNEVSGIYTATRHQRINGRYYPTPWEGHFSQYVSQSGVRVPSYGEVGWYHDGRWECVWRATISNMKFNFHRDAS
jgi:hypothetical protein